MKKNKETKKKPSAGEVIGSALRVIVDFFVFFVKTVAKFLAYTGLWIPLLYVLFGFVLYWTLGFDPIQLDVWGALYLSGAVACVLACLIILVRNAIVRPVKNIVRGYKNPIWKRRKFDEKTEAVRSDKLDKKFSPPKIEDYSPMEEEKIEYLAPIEDFAVKNDEETRHAQYSLYPDWLPKIDDTGSQTEPHVVSVAREEAPKIYRSGLDPDVVVHEYSDRFELYKIKGGKEVNIGVEFK
ncbi:MAG: hypothetical protein IJ735_07580 [Clostridia bacterium]|nr:hypothetical protein [Clostridia bacterium]